MIAPTPRLVSWTGPSTRRKRCSPAISSSSNLSGFLAKSRFPEGAAAPCAFAGSSWERGARTSTANG